MQAARHVLQGIDRHCTSTAAVADPIRKHSEWIQFYKEDTVMC